MPYLVLLFALTTSVAQAQAPPRGAPLPDLSALPTAPPDLRLPGPDPRECGPTKFSALCAEGRWLQFARIAMKGAGPKFAADYTIDQAVNGEMHATYRERVA